MDATQPRQRHLGGIKQRDPIGAEFFRFAGPKLAKLASVGGWRNCRIENGSWWDYSAHSAMMFSTATSVSPVM